LFLELVAFQFQELPGRNPAAAFIDLAQDG
jgi:hypothetical protein